VSVKICEHCGTENPASEDICGDCSFPLDDGESQDVSSDDAEIKCPKCEATVRNDMHFCDSCGAPLSAPDSEPDIEEEDDDSISTPPASIPLPEPDIDDTAMPIQEPDSARGWKLKVVEGMQVGKEYMLFKDEMLIGRADEEDDIAPDIDLEGQDDGYVSRNHAIVRISNGKVSVEDSGSANGTRLDNRKLEANTLTPVRNGQVIRTGKVGLMLQKD